MQLKVIEQCLSVYITAIPIWLFSAENIPIDSYRVLGYFFLFERGEDDSNMVSKIICWLGLYRDRYTDMQNSYTKAMW